MLATSTGTLAIAVTVGSSAPGASGSSVSTMVEEGRPVTRPWLTSSVTAAGHGTASATAKRIVAVPPGWSVPSATRTGDSLVTWPLSVVTEPVTMVLLAGVGSSKARPLKGALAMLAIVTV